MNNGVNTRTEESCVVEPPGNIRSADNVIATERLKDIMFRVNHVGEVVVKHDEVADPEV